LKSNYKIMQAETKNNQIEIYKSPDGPMLSVKFEGETVWVTQEQIALLFGTQRPAITKHLNNIFKSAELSEKTVSSILEHTATDGKKYKVKFYNLDAVISVGYRVNSKRATQFRVWATQRLREYVLKGYVINERRLLETQEEKFKELQAANKLFLQVIESRRAEGYEKDLLSLITDYTNTWFVLSQDDKGDLAVELVSKKKPVALEYLEIRKSIDKFKARLTAKKEAGDLFGQEVGEKFLGVLGSVTHTYNGKDLYASVEEKAAHLLYFCIKDHPFADGNKRIGSLVFLLYLLQNRHLMNKKGERRINDSALAALALLVAESKPEQKKIMVKLIINLINKP